MRSTMPLPIPPENMSPIIHPEARAAIGAVASEWAILERIIDGTIWQMGNFEPEAGACVTSQLPNIGRKLDALTALSWLRDIDPKIVGELNSFNQNIHGLGKRRNRIVHDTWTVGVDSKIHYRLEITAEKKLRFDFAPTEIQEIYKVANDIIERRNAYLEIEKKLFGGLSAWRQKRSEASAQLNQPDPSQSDDVPNTEQQETSLVQSIWARLRGSFNRA
jgi:hypothetical protein